MKEHPILFTGEMVRAILDGKKTQTRRVIKPQPSAGVRASVFVPSGIEDGHGREVRCRWAVGNVLWVRETWGFYDQFFDYNAGKTGGVIFCADGMPDNCHGTHWRPSIYMPRWASRITLRITDIRAQRVKDISEEDAQAEGSYIGRCQCMPRSADRTPIESMFRQSWCHIHGVEFASLWDSINAKRGFPWASNPWVWAITFVPEVTL